MNRKWILTFLVILGFAAVLVVAAGFFYFSGQPSKPKFDFVLAERRDLIQFVAVTGTVRPIDKVDLAFEVTGRIDMVLADIGDRVKVGDALIKLSNSDLTSELSRAQADLQNEKARLLQLQAALDVEIAALEELERGTRDEEIEVSQVRLQNAYKSKQDAELILANAINIAGRDIENLYDRSNDILNDVYLAVDDAILIKTDDMFSKSFVDKGDLVFIVSDAKIEADARNGRRDSLDILVTLKDSVGDFPESQDEADLILENTENDLTIVQNFLFALSLSLAEEINLSESQKTIFQSNVDLARDAISLTRTSLSSIVQQIRAQKAINKNNIDQAQNALNEAENTIILAQKELDLKRAATLPEKIDSQKARILQAEANIKAQRARIQSAQSLVDIVLSKLEKTVLRAPIDGIVTVQEARAGEIVALTESFSTTVMSIISDNAFEIKANIPEVDIAKVKIGDQAEITLDAYGADELFTVAVSQIDPAETVIEGVPTYSVTFIFTDYDSRIKSGMTANMDILTASVDNVIAIPARTVIFKSGRKFVRVISGDGFVEKNVSTGLRSWDGLIEITSGLNEGDRVITFIEE